MQLKMCPFCGRKISIFKRIPKIYKCYFCNSTITQSQITRSKRGTNVPLQKTIPKMPKVKSPVYDPPSNRLLYVAAGIYGIKDIDGLTTLNILEKIKEKEFKGYK